MLHQLAVADIHQVIEADACGNHVVGAHFAFGNQLDRRRELAAVGYRADQDALVEADLVDE